ncbi:hypothetical protein RCO27_11450 [Sphingosinicella sp. LHD-64]|uniref:hypothetical protein n=1 Tax=Sphingosinicella sp. LHD-64 TaxID=3072139 RepID=UPI00280F5CD4|nr:hypothetical protein [Sphingosinicella sp. LHD-64]MDQ8756842.1 hypothetical protein [Sphingosinicella sp. LHD-64]
MHVSLLAALLFVAQADAPADEDAQTAVENTEEDGDDALICRRRVVESGRVGERMRSVRVCKTREEWNSDRRNGRRGA